MDITVVEAPHSTAFTTLARVKRELGIAPDETAKDELLTDLIEESSAAIIAYCGQPFVRQTVIERQVGFGRTVQVLSVTPVPPGGLDTVLFNDVPVSGCFVSQPNAGFVFNPNRFMDTRPRQLWIEIDPAIMPGYPDYQFHYTGGYLLPGDDLVVPSGAATVDAAGGYFELASGEFPILVSGETVVTAGFAAAENNGRHRVLGRTQTRLYVASTLADEASIVETTFAVRTLPRDLEAAAVGEVKARFYQSQRDTSLTSERLGDWSATYGGKDTSGQETGGLSPATAGRLTTYVRLDD